MGNKEVLYFSESGEGLPAGLRSDKGEEFSCAVLETLPPHLLLRLLCI